MKYILITALLMLTFLLAAAPVTQAAAEQAARNWTAVWAPQESKVRSLDRVIPLSMNDEIQLYLFQYADGYVVTSADDAVYPVLAYGFDTVVNGMDRNPAFRDFLATMMEEIVQIKSDNLDNSETSAKWREVLENRISRNDTRSQAPLISTRWNQDYPYNMYCPADAAGPGGHVYAGCVATAMGQVTKYWNWPVTGSGSHTYTAQGYGSQSANFGATTYQWVQMPNSVHAANDAVARLLYHLGVSVNMMYAPDGSGAYSNAVPGALMNYFRYASGAQQRMKSSYSTAAWEQLLRDELDAARPMYYSGSGSGGGHAFNCDGYQNNNYFHFNWGWGGSYDGYFYVSNLNPGSTFNSYQGAIFNVIPQNYSIASVQMALNGSDCSVGDVTTLSVVSYPILPAWNVSDISFIIEFDEENMNFVGVNATGTMLEGSEIYAMEIQPGRVSVAASTSSNLIGGGTLLKLEFQPMVPGNFAFNLSNFALNTTNVPLLAPTSINVTAEVCEVECSVIDLLNAMHIPYDAIATVPLTTTFVLPNWNVTTASFVVNFPADMVTWEGFDAAGCIDANPVVDVQNPQSGQVNISMTFSGNLVGGGTLLNLKFRATGNVGYVSLATVTITDFYYNQILVNNLQPGYIVLLPVTSNEDGIAVPETRFSAGPNPFNSMTNLSLKIAKANQATRIDIYNLKGQLVKSLFDAELKGNQLDLQWNGSDNQNKAVPAGMYLIKMKSGDYSQTIKLIKMK
jgi:hypothetical protein